MANRTPKPSTKEKALATIAQAPIGAQIRSLAQAGLDDSEQLEFFKPDTWFQSDEDDYSNPFAILSARLWTKGQYGARVILKLAEGGINGERSLVSLPADDSRIALANTFKLDTRPIAPCVFKRLDTGKGNPYYAIADAKEASETNDVDFDKDDDLPL